MMLDAAYWGALVSQDPTDAHRRLLLALDAPEGPHPLGVAVEVDILVRLASDEARRNPESAARRVARAKTLVDRASDADLDGASSALCDLGYHLVGCEDPAGARAVLTKLARVAAAEHDGVEPFAILALLAAIHGAEGDSDAEIMALRQATEEVRGRPEPMDAILGQLHGRLADALRRAGERDEELSELASAATHYEQARLTAMAADARLARVRRLREDGRSDAARDELRLALANVSADEGSAFPAMVPLLIEHGRDLLETGDAAAARDRLEQARALADRLLAAVDPTDASTDDLRSSRLDALGLLGLAHANTDDLDRAIAVYDDAIRDHDGATLLHLRRAHWLAARGRVADAIAAFAALTQHPGLEPLARVTVYRELAGVQLDGADDPAAAEAALREALRLTDDTLGGEPERPRLVRELAIVLGRQKQWAAALVLLERALHQGASDDGGSDVETAATLMAIAQLETDRGDTGAASQRWDDVVAFVDERPDLPVHLVAAARYRAARAALPDNPDRALAHLQACAAVEEEAYGPVGIPLAVTFHAVVGVHLLRDDEERAVDALARLGAVFDEHRTPATGVPLVRALADFGAWYLRGGDAVSGVHTAANSLMLVAMLFPDRDPVEAEPYGLLIQALFDLGSVEGDDLPAMDTPALRAHLRTGLDRWRARRDLPPALVGLVEHAIDSTSVVEPDP